MLNVSRFLCFSRRSAFLRRRISDAHVQNELETLRRECTSPQHIDPNDVLREQESLELESVLNELDGHYGGRNDVCGRKRNSIKSNPNGKNVFTSSGLSFGRGNGQKMGKYDFDVTEVPEYEFESFKKKPKFQDLTHQEQRNLKELKLNARLGDPEDLLNLQKSKVDVRREAKIRLRDEEKLDCELSEINRFDEMASKIRQDIRNEKLQMSKVNKATVPSWNGLVIDPIRNHVQRRALRISAMLKENIEQLLICNDPEFLYQHLGGANISIVRVEMPTSKSTIKCLYTCKFNAGLTDAELQNRLDFISPKMRFWLARKLQLGYTPPVKFIPLPDMQSLRPISAPLFNLPLETTLKSVAKTFDKDRGGY